MRNCGKESCPACKGSLDTKAPSYEEATDDDKLMWTTCRRRAAAIDFAAEEKLYASKSLSNLKGERDEAMAAIEKIDEQIGDEQPSLSEDPSVEEVEAAVDHATLLMTKLDHMMKLQTINRHINLKLQDWQEG